MPNKYFFVPSRAEECRSQCRSCGTNAMPCRQFRASCSRRRAIHSRQNPLLRRRFLQVRRFSFRRAQAVRKSIRAHSCICRERIRALYEFQSIGALRCRIRRQKSQAIRPLGANGFRPKKNCAAAVCLPAKTVPDRESLSHTYT